MVPSLLAGPTSVAPFIAAIYLVFLSVDKSSSEILLIVSVAFSLAFCRFVATKPSTMLFKRAFVSSRLLSVSVLSGVAALSTSASPCFIVAELIFLIAASFSSFVK